MRATDAVQITADNTNVFLNRQGAKPPSWARKARLQVVASDTDWTFDCTYAGLRFAEDCGPHRAQADNLQQADWNSPHIEFNVLRGSDETPLVDVNVVTAGVGIVHLEYSS